MWNVNFWPYNQVDDVGEDFRRLGHGIDGLVVILRTPNDEQYYEFKELFSDSRIQFDRQNAF